MIKIVKKLLPFQLKNLIKSFHKNIKNFRNSKKIIEHMEIDFMLSRLYKKKTINILEIGSHLGEIFNIISGNNFDQLFKIVCIEPNPSSFSKLQKNLTRKIRKIAEVNFYNIGVSSEDDILPFYSPSVSSALFTLNKENLNKFELKNQSINVVNVQTYKIKTLLYKKLIQDNYDIIKIDAEGSDYQIANQIIDNSIIFANLMIELDESNLNLLSNLFNKLEDYSAYVFLRDGIKTLSIEKTNGISEIRQLINDKQAFSINPIAGNIVFVKEEKLNSLNEDLKN